MDILKLIKLWENSKLEFKEDIGHNDSFAWEIVSFLNADWWIILLWISDNWYKADIKYDYPIEAIRETLINAMLHRDYTYIWANIRVFMFEDRIEIMSPWVLPKLTYYWSSK